MAGKDYAAIARSRIVNTTKDPRKPRIFIYGRNKKGKTRFCTTAPNVLILDPESGTAQERVRRPDTWPIDRWDDIVDAAGFLKSKSNKSPTTGKPYEWVAWDGCTRITDIALNFIRAQEMERDLSRRPTDVKIQDYGRSNKMIQEAVHQFHALRDIGLIFTCQERMIEIANMEDLDDDDSSPAGYMYVPDLPKGARAPFNQVADVIGRIYVVRGDFVTTRLVRRKSGELVEREVPTTTQRRLWIGPHDMYDTGARSDYVLPDFIKDPTVPTLVQAMRTGKVDD